MAAGALLKQLLKANKRTIKWLSENADIPLQTLYSITQRDSGTISEKNLIKIAKALNIDLGSLRRYFLLGTEIGSNKVKPPTPDSQDNYYPEDVEVELYNLQYMYNISREEAFHLRNMVQDYLSLNEEGQEKVEIYAKDLKTSGNYIKNNEIGILEKKEA